MQFVYVLIEYCSDSGIFENKGVVKTEQEAVAWKYSGHYRTYDKWRVK